MSDQQFERAVNDWLEDGSDRTPRRAIDGVLLAVKTTPQERDLRIPWRFPQMLPFLRATGIAAVAVVAVVGVGALLYSTSNRPGGVGSQGTPAPTTPPTVAPTPGSSEVAPGITGWKPYTSEVHGFSWGYPADWSVHEPATRKWQVGDRLLGADVWPYADTFVSPGEGDDSIGLFVWEVPAERDSAGLESASVDTWKAWAQEFCSDIGAPSCDQFTQQAVPMCQNEGGDSCRSAILVPTADAQYAFFVDWGSAMIVGPDPDQIRVVVVAREDGFPSAARYGGSVELLKAILTTMNVWTPGQKPGS